MTGVYTPWSICRDQRITLGGSVLSSHQVSPWTRLRLLGLVARTLPAEPSHGPSYINFKEKTVLGPFL